MLALLWVMSVSQVICAKGLVISTHPIFLIAEQVTKGIEQPTLLLTPQQTGHDIQLTPKNRQVIQDADLVIWLGKQHEAPLENVLAGRKNAISLLNSHLLNTLPERDVKGQPIANTLDSHVWLEPNNAMRIAFFIAALRGQQEPQNKAKYWANAQNFAQKMRSAAKSVEPKALSYHYWAYHDAYQYLDRVLRLQFAGSLTADHDLAPTITQIKFLNQNRPVPNMCLLAEYHTDRSFLQRLQPVKVAAVDEAMSDQNDFVTGWLKLAQSIQQCAA